MHAYSACEGLALGGISTAAESRFRGIASQAIFLTFRTLGALLLVYRSGLIRASEKFKLGVFAATAASAFVYLAGFVMSFFGGWCDSIDPRERHSGHRVQPIRDWRRSAEPRP